MRELYFLAEDDVDLSAKTWYYALSLELILDAGIVLETYEKSYNYYKEVLGKNAIYKCLSKFTSNYLWILKCVCLYMLYNFYVNV